MVPNMNERIEVGSQVVFSASEATLLTKKVIKQRQENKEHRIGFGTAALDSYLIPSWPGDLVLVCGRPQNYKTAYMQTIMHQATKDIKAQNKQDECTVLVTWEVNVEQAMSYWLSIESGISATKMMKGDVDLEWEKLDLAIAKVASSPVYIIGHSGSRDSDRKRRRPHLPPSIVSLALDYLMNEMELEPRMICMDYLQRIPMEKGANINQNQHHSQCVDWAKDTALWAGCPVYLGTQARREVDDRTIKLPGLRDSQWSSNAEQSADKFLSLWMPKQAHDEGDKINVGKKLGNLTVTDKLLLLAVAKQKFGPAGEIFPLIVDPEHLKLEDASPYSRKPIKAIEEAEINF